jgi:hypothetical protein
VHLASAATLRSAPLVVATWDARLGVASEREGLTVAPVPDRR